MLQSLLLYCPPNYRIKASQTNVMRIKIFPKTLGIYRGENLRSNVETMQRYFEEIIIAYIERVRDEFDLPLRQKALCIFMFIRYTKTCPFWISWWKRVLKLCLYQRRVPCLQSLNIQINGLYETLLKSEFQIYYANEVKCSLEKGVDIKNVKVAMHLS